MPDPYGYGRIPAFWYTLNLPFNYLYEIHRFQRAAALCSGSAEGVREGETCLDPRGSAAKAVRCAWVLDSPDIVVVMHAIRIEILVGYVLAHVVPQDPSEPFQYWLRFEWAPPGTRACTGRAGWRATRTWRMW